MLNKKKFYLVLKLKSLTLKILEENKKLRNALYEQFYNEKIKILNAVNIKIDVYYKSSMQGEVNRLTTLETSVKNQIDEIVDELLNRKNLMFFH
ncbi:hypothetical protein [Clostridium sporogenes]|uniref:hypothetical protein n=1 Tax=Clostridium sporogenes TaxID=1509 RepID=UPI001FAC5F38|nr:hypothetical protein [Clostridium sporogenes]